MVEFEKPPAEPRAAGTSIFGALPLGRTLTILILAELIFVLVPVAWDFGGGPRFHHVYRHPIDWTTVAVDASTRSATLAFLLFLTYPLIGPVRVRGAFTKLGFRDVAWIALAVASIYALGYIIPYAQFYAFHIVPGPSQITHLFETSAPTLATFAFWATGTFVAPMLEEIKYRGLLLGALATRLGWWPAAAISAVIFAALHFDPRHFLWIFGVGLVLSYLLRRTGTLWAPYAAHATVNGASLTWDWIRHATH